ncbi:3-hydroxyacyl-CoA dehydrogenase family protein [Labilibaculum sp.]|uniref:3-hydroxyacyl-CoA dehydrogenase family protein n=1 Tax=Labilibaculum sp. TaxID=2060723 RepID=UPI003568ADCA
MDLIRKMENVSVLGAAGKMGSGILVLLSFEMAKLKIGRKENKEFVLHAIDISQSALGDLLSYLKTQLLKHAEKNIVELRTWYQERADLIDNEEIINQFKEDVMAMVKTSTRIETAYDSQLIFEAIKEDKKLKVNLLSKIKQNNPDAWFLTNTSSIPIGEIEKEAGLSGNIIGYHFYNPPVVQKLLELVVTEHTSKDLSAFALELAKSMRKTLVQSRDVAGFIGNGHFMRDALYALNQAEKLAKTEGWAKAFFMIDTISRDLLIRPMGIFQLLDYVGIDVTHFILESMQPSFPKEKLSHFVLNQLFDKDVKGGQFADGSQKNGIFKYQKGRIAEVYNLKKDKYIPISSIEMDCAVVLGALPTFKLYWKSVVRDATKSDLLQKFFNELHQLDSLGANLAIAYGKNAKAIGKMLVDTNVAASEADVNMVLETGFFHAYGPINDYF